MNKLIVPPSTCISEGLLHQYSPHFQFEVVCYFVKLSCKLFCEHDVCYQVEGPITGGFITGILRYSKLRKAKMT